MEILFVLAGGFVISLAVIRLLTKKYDHWPCQRQVNLAGRIAMSAMLLLTAAGHFIYTHGMEMMMPEFIPMKKELVYFTGFIEIAAAAGLLIPKLQRITSILLIIFFILILPANIYAAMNSISLKTGDSTGPGLSYLWLRIPMQILFIAWVWWFGVRESRKEQ